MIQQLSVFIENKKGRLAEVTQLLAENQIDIRALSLADTTDYGILRLIVDRADDAVSVLKEAGITVAITNVIGIAIEDIPGGFAKAMSVLASGNIDVEYSYAFVSRSDDLAFVILRVENAEAAAKALTENDIKIISQSDIF